jgi:hypothetical protein
MRSAAVPLVVGASLVFCVVAIHCPAGRASNDAEPEPEWTNAARQDALQRAQVWRPPAVAIERADLRRSLEPFPDELTCTFVIPRTTSGSTSKFDCRLRDGTIVKVKYRGAEPHGEVAASRLLTALGFGADNVEFVRKVRCFGCPWEPFAMLKVVELARAQGLFQRVVNYGRWVDFDWVAVESRFPGERIETADVRGWSWHEFAESGGASREHSDALRLLAVFLAHWDNKAENQRLVCLTGSPDSRGHCRAPFAMLQDVGATFGPRKVELTRWRESPVWKDRSTCEVSMEHLPHDGATFVPVRISEGGRRFLADRLTRLSEAQVEGLFEAARFQHHGGTVREWTEAFMARVREIADGLPCPSARTVTADG